MKNALRLIITLILGSLSPWLYAGEEKPLDFKDVPEKILAMAKEAMPSVTFKTANTEDEDGTLIYEIQGTLEDGRKVEVDLFDDGKIQEIEIEFHKDLVPGAVLKAIEKKLPGFQAEYIEASHSASKKVTKYEFVGQFSGETMDIEVSADGRKIEIADQ